MIGPTGRSEWLLFVFVGLLAGPVRSAGAEQSAAFWLPATDATRPRLPKGYEPLPSLGALIKQLSPAVVNLTCAQQCPPIARVDPDWEAFGHHRSPDHPVEAEPERRLRARSLGSGFIIHPDGFVVTNAHVVAGMTRVWAQLTDGRRLEAAVLGADQLTDLALLKIDSSARLPAVVLGDSAALQVGDWVMALGNPYGLTPSASAGIISAGAHPAGSGGNGEFLQTDAAINPGNSGGPLFDKRGVVIGINTASAAGYTGVGLAVPVDLAKQVLPRLREHGRVRRGWLGVGVQDLTTELAAEFGVVAGQGVLVSQVYPDSPAQRAGLSAGDVLLQLDVEAVADARDLTRRIGSLAPGARIRLQVMRAGAKKTFKVRLAERSPPPPQAPAPPGPGGRADRLGLELSPLTPERSRRMGLEPDLKGVAVTGVDPDGPTAGLLQAGDLILEVNRVAIADLPGFIQAAAAEPDRVLLRIQRGQAQAYVVFKVPGGAGPGGR